MSQLFLNTLHAVRAGGQSVPPNPVVEYRFDLMRKWKFDFAWPLVKVAVEIEGMKRGSWGRHQRQVGYANDCEKYNAAAEQGWIVLRYTSQQLLQRPTHVFEQICRAIFNTRKAVSDG